MLPGIVGIAGLTARPFFATDYGALIGIANDNTSTQAQGASAAAVSYPFTAYDALGWKQGTTTLQVPVSQSVQLVRLIGDSYLSTGGGQTYRFKRWDGSAFNTFTGNGGGRPNRTGESDENMHSAILAVAAGDQFQLWKDTTLTATANNGGTRNFFGVEVIRPGTRYTFVNRSTTQSFTANVKTNILFNDATDIVDTLGSHNPLSNPDQFVIPADTTGLVRVSAYAAAGAANTGTLNLKIALNGTDIAYAAQNQGTATPSVNVAGPILAVVPGDIVTVSVQLSGGTSISGLSWCCVEELPSNHRYCLLRKSANQAIGSGTQITWDTVVHDPDGAHDNVNTQRINFPNDATEFRITLGITSTAAGLLYVNGPPGYWPGYAGGANGRTVYNAIGPWHPTRPNITVPYSYAEGFGMTQANGGVTSSFFQLEFR